MSTLWHLEVDIAGALLKSDEDLDGVFESSFGVPLTGPGVREYLEECQAKGWKVFPVGNCPTFCYQDGCPGHEESETI